MPATQDYASTYKQSYDEAKLYNNKIMGWIEGGQEKKASEAIDDYTRLRIREDGFTRKVLPALPITNAELDRSVTSEVPFVVVDMEVDSPGAVSIAYASLPDQEWMRGSRYGVQFDRIVSTRWVKDAAELRTWKMDIRRVISDNSLKDIMAEEDTKLIGTCNRMMGSPDATVAFTGGKHWRTIYGGIDRDSLEDALKTLPMLPGSLEAETILVNSITIRDIMKGTRNEMGGDLSQDLLVKGWTLQEFMNAQWIITIKRDLVPDQSMYMFASPQYMGKLFSLEEPTMWIKREAFMIEFFLYEELGGTIANPNSVGRVDFA